MVKSSMAVRKEEEDFFLPDLCNKQSIFFLVLIAELLVLVLVLANKGILYFSWTQLALSSLFVQWVVLCSAGLLCTARPVLSRKETMTATALGFGIIMTVTLIFSLFAEWLLLDRDLGWEAKQWAGIFRNMIISAVMTGLAFRYFYLQHQLRRKEQAELNSRIQALQSRIRPHFLFNSMNIITSLIGVDPETAELVVEDLSSLFRASLTEASGEPVIMEEELQLCDKYIHIESLRLDDRLDVNWKITVDTGVVKIPLLSLQPLIENAIYHGIQPLPEGGTVDVTIERVEEMIRIEITNPTPKKSPRLDGIRVDGNQMALDNIRSRMEAIYGDESRVITHEGEGFYRTVVTYPDIS